LQLGIAARPWCEGRALEDRVAALPGTHRPRHCPGPMAMPCPAQAPHQWRWWLLWPQRARRRSSRRSSSSCRARSACNRSLLADMAGAWQGACQVGEGSQGSDGGTGQRHEAAACKTEARIIVHHRPAWPAGMIALHAPEQLPLQPPPLLRLQQLLSPDLRPGKTPAGHHCLISRNRQLTAEGSLVAECSANPLQLVPSSASCTPDKQAVVQ